MEKISKFKNSLSLKLFIIGFLILVLMIPTAMIAVLVNEREGRQQDAIYEVSEKWGREQTITGPILTIPYRKIYENNVNGVISSNETIAYAHFLPD
ncbi:cell envelope integrity protein CreD, partial [Candidatus Parcubacteria bacterium]